MPLDMPTLINTFETSVATGEGIGSDFVQKIIIESGALTVPIGAIVPWCKSFTGVPDLITQGFSAMFVECKGQVLVDPDSLLNGQTIPNLNGNSEATKIFLRGAATSGGTGGAATFSGHTTNSVTLGGAGTFPFDQIGGSGGSGNTTYNISMINPYYEIVWLMRVK